MGGEQRRRDVARAVRLQRQQGSADDPGAPVVDGEHLDRVRRRVRPLDARDLAHYVASGEWEGRAGAYAIQGLGASLVERIEGDYLNVVGLPAALLVRLLAERFAGTYGFG